jgi:DNA-binding NtrC family response regulator
VRAWSASVVSARVLVVDDDPHLPKLLVRVLAHAGYAAEVASSGEQALEVFSRLPADVALLDVKLPGMSGLETFGKLREQAPGVIGIFMTAFGSIRSAVDAMRAGGFDYLTKPFDNDQLVLTLDRALELRRLGKEVRELREELGSRVAFPGIVGRGPRMLEILRLLPRIATSDATTLILGESGTGKELVARSLHRASPRGSGPFVAVNCSAIPVGLFETEFFGHERGAFTDAHARRIGRLEHAQGGTLFLDEIADLPVESQAKLLRVLEDGQVVPLGGQQAVDVDLRLIAATNKDLAAEVAAGRFRQDLYWRINVVTVALPPLRERREDLPLLIRHFIDRLNLEVGRDVRGLTPEATERLMTYDWPGNIRELENTLRRAFVMAEGDVITCDELTMPSGGGPASAEEPPAELSLPDVVARSAARIERDLIDSTLARYRGNRAATAQALGINRKTLFRKIRQYELRRWIDPSETDE